MPLTGILTFHSVPNFGAFLQSWSLLQTINRLGRKAEVIDYRPAGHEAKYRRQGIKAWVPSVGRWRMERFMTRHLELSPTVRRPDQVDALIDTGRYDRLVCGSDQIWYKDPFRGFDRTYFLGVGQAGVVRRIAYAPSCGSMDSFGEDTAQARELIGRLDAISVRDSNALKLVQSLGFDNVQRVADPTLLADFKPIIGAKPIRREYLAVVGPMNADSNRLIRDVASRRKLAVVAVGTRCEAADIEKRFANAGDWITCLAHAQGVVSSLFHGAAVSIALRKPFLAIDSGGRAFKLTDLLDRFGLMSQFVTATNRQSTIDGEWLQMDYRASEAMIRKDIENSLAYLRSALND